ncbi:hypothetical protein CYMTET_55206 [Cymbomonas tetramitiformis]|uniref:PD-(D/E)XK endonuclease-like domain-containing protein n=1 Tax=Cymbomonas tetramitiformis TaxID=36881 RepID=A0AAE0BDM5_9CHLO|nr:hypothetical protein CYMTET_55206 [Cymbomonas tetramitiformis]
MDFLQELNSHARDSRIGFDEATHKYFIDGKGRNVTSVTTFLKTFFDEFNAKKTLNKYGRRWRSDRHHKYYAKSDDEILCLWEKNRREQSELGTRMHERFELFYNDACLNRCSFISTPISSCDALHSFPAEYEQFNRFHKKYDIRPFRTEMRVFDESLRIAGSIDLIAVESTEDDSRENKGQVYVMYDWKRSSKELSPDAPHYGRMCKHSLGHIPDTAYTHYVLQQNMYAHLLKRFYDIKIARMYLVRFHPSIDEFQLIPVPLYEKEVQIVMTGRRVHLQRVRRLKGILAASLFLLRAYNAVKKAKRLKRPIDRIL